MKIKRSNYFIPEDCRFTLNVKEKEPLNKGLIKYPCYMFLDQATKTGISIFDYNRRLITTYYIEKEKNTEIPEFRSKLRKKLTEIVKEYEVFKIFYEGVFGGPNFETTTKLISIKELVVDVAYESGVKSYGLENTKWKARLLENKKVNNRLNDKEKVRLAVEEYYPLIKKEEDVIDSLGMAIAVLFCGKDKKRPIEMRLNKRLPIELDVYVIHDLSEIGEKISKKRKLRRLLDESMKVFDYDTTIDLETNFKYVLSNYNTVAVAEIPQHRYYGQILLKYNIRPKELKDTGTLIGIAYRK